MADRKISDLTALTTPASGDYLPIVDISEAAAASKNKRITIEELMRGVPDGTAAAPGIAFETDPNTGIYRPGADQLAVATNGVGRLFVDGSGNVGVGTSPGAQGAQLDILSSGFSNLRVRSSAANSATINLTNSARNYSFNTNSGNFYIRDESVVAERLRITSAGLVGIGTSSPAQLLDVSSTSNAVARINSGAANTTGIILSRGGTEVVRIASTATDVLTISNGSAVTPRLTIDSSGRLGIGTTSPSERLEISGNFKQSNGTQGLQIINTTVPYIQAFTSGGNNPLQINGQDLRFFTGSSFGAEAERARIDSSGRLLVGTSTALDTSAGRQLQVSDANGAYLILGRDDTTVGDGPGLGGVHFYGNDTTSNAWTKLGAIDCSSDGTHGPGDNPTRLVFSTTADGAASPTERMRITNSGATYSLINNSEGRALGTLSAASASNYFIQGVHGKSSIQAGGTRSFGVFTNGNVVNTNNSYGAISDLKLKENIVDAGSQWDDLKALQVRNYNFKEGQTHTQIGLVAQEVELVSPGLVGESPDRDEDGNDLGTVTKSVNYSVLYMKAVKALQEAMERIETLEARLTAAGIE
jgi:hypothetical protein